MQIKTQKNAVLCRLFYILLYKRSVFLTKLQLLWSNNNEHVFLNFSNSYQI